MIKIRTRCHICECYPGPFFIWSSSRSFPREKMIKVFGIKDRNTMKILLEGVEVCYECFDKLKNHDD